VTHTVNNPSDLDTLAWPQGTIGDRVITVTATNAGGTAASTHTVTFGDHRIYLPLVIKQ